MIMRSRLVWKLSAVVVAILAAAISLSGIVNNQICAYYTLKSARDSLRFNTESINKGIGQLMMNRDIDGIQELIAGVSQDSTVYRSIRLVSHLEGNYGKVVASRSDNKDEEVLAKGDRRCAVCHDQNNGDDVGTGIQDNVVAHPNGERVLWVMAPILYEQRCIECHSGFDDEVSPQRKIMGFLSADYSLQQVDAMATGRWMLIIITVFASLFMGIVALWFMFTRQLERPISALIAGTKRIAANQLDFRFEQKRNDEIGVLEESMNAMTAKIQAHRDELRSAMEYLDGMVENSADLIITVTSEGYIETFNRGAEQALGYGRVEVIGRQIESLFVDPSERRMIAERLKDTGNIRNYETRLLTKDGQVRNVLLTLSYLRDKEGKLIGTIGISKDITQEKKLQQELVQSQKFAAIGQAMIGIQHAIKNMLNALKGGSYLVRNGMARNNRQRIEEGRAMVEDGIERISSLSHSMLDYVKEWKLELQRVDLNDLVVNVCELNRQTAADQGVALHQEVTGGLPAVLCDPKLIHMATTDMVVNAIDACVWKDYGSDESPEVVMKSSLREGGDFFVIEIRDNGCGMNEEIRRNIFTPFFSTKKNQSTGLGLALTAKIIKVHAGEISVESEPDRGAVFRIDLPIDGPG